MAYDFGCPVCGSTEIGVWLRRYEMRDVSRWNADGTPAFLRKEILDTRDEEYATPPGAGGRYMCANGHEFDQPEEAA